MKLLYRFWQWYKPADKFELLEMTGNGIVGFCIAVFSVCIVIPVCVAFLAIIPFGFVTLSIANFNDGMWEWWSIPLSLALTIGGIATFSKANK